MKDRVQKAISLKEKIAHYDIDVDVSDRNIVTLNGVVDDWNDVVEIGHLAAKVKGVRNVVNDITSKDYHIEKEDNTEKIQHRIP